jgi:DNA-directed RNA polymerase specialized sigma24 family protein
MTRTDSPLNRLVAWAADDADTLHYRRLAARWSAAHPALAAYRSLGEIVRSGWADNNTAAVVVADLMAVGDAEGVGVQAALAVLAPRLARVVARWARAGVPACDLEDMEAELLAETLARLQDRPEPQPPGAVVDLAWGRVRNTRRRHRRAAGRQVSLDESTAAASEAPAVLGVAALVVVDGFRSGRLSLPGAQALWATGVAGWSGVDAAARLGCGAAALRARRSRAIRALAA